MACKIKVMLSSCPVSAGYWYQSISNNALPAALMPVQNAQTVPGGLHRQGKKKKRIESRL
jgi:hypothetical protein